MRGIVSIVVAVALVGVLGGAVSPGWAQEDSLIVVCDYRYPANATVHLPVYARVNEQDGQGLTGLSLMFYNDHPGLSISSIEWDGPSIGEANTAINEFIGNPELWAMNNICSDGSCRGGVGMLSYGSTPSIPSGHHLLCWLVVQAGDYGDYLIEPRDGMGDPVLTNSFAYQMGESYPALMGDTAHVGMHLVLNAPAAYFADEGQSFCFDVRAMDADSGHQMTLTMLEGPSGATLDPDPNVGYSSITSQFCWTPDYCAAGDHGATFQVTCPEDTVQWATTIFVENVNRNPAFASSDPGCPAAVSPEELLEIDIVFVDLDMAECGDDSLILTFIGPGDRFDDHGDGTGTYRWTPAEDDTGVHLVTFFADDLYGGNVEHQCQIIVSTEFIRGDYNADGGVTTTDALNLLEWLLGGGDSPSCMDAADANDDGSVDNFDVLYLLYFVEDSLAPPPPPPYPACGLDPTPDGIGCRTHHYCDSLGTGIYFPEESSTLPRGFSLCQNYPNPFNPITKISYELPHNCWVKLEVYNLLGRRVITLVDEVQAAGYQSVPWDARSPSGNEVAGGIYFYRLEAGDFAETRQMILLK